MQSNLSRKNNDINSEIRAFAIFLDEIYRIADEKRHNENEVVFVCITRKCYDMLDIALHKFPEYFTENVKSVKRYSDRQILFNRSLVDNAMICMIDDSINFGGAIKTLYKKLGFLNTNQKNIIVATYLLSESLQGEYVKEYFEENKIEFCYGRKINNDELARFICDEIKFIHENKGAYTIDLPMYDTQNISDFDITKLVENYSNIVVNYDLSILGKEKINNVLFEVCSYSIMKKLGKLIMGMFIKVEERRIDNAFVFTPYVLLNNIDVKYLKKIIEHFFADMTNYSYYFSTEEENDDNCLLMYKVLVFLLSYQIGEIFFSQCKDFLEQICT